MGVFSIKMDSETKWRNAMISVKNIRKSYKDNVVLKNVSMEVDEGDFVAIVGKNGSGKSTLVEIICKMREADSGTIEYGFDEKDIYRNMGIQFQNADFDVRMKVKTLLKLWKEIYNIEKKKYDDLVELLNLSKVMDRKIANISGGEKQRMNIFLALINDPKVIILDELTTGLDALTRLEIRQYLKEINRNQKKTIIMVSHYMDEVDELCNKVYFLKDGVISEAGKIIELKNKYNVEHMDGILEKVLA